MTSTTLPARADVPKELTWDLESVYPTDKAWEDDFAKIKTLMPKLAAFKGKLVKTGKSLADALALRDEISRIMSKVYVYANMRLHQDTSNATYQAFASRASTLSNELAAATSFMTPELLAVKPERIAGLMKRSKALRVYQHEFDELNLSRAHVRTPEIEELLAGASEVGQAPENIFEMLDNADLKLPVVKDGAGNDVQLTHGNYASVCLQSNDRVLRENAFKGMHGAYNGLRNTLATTYAAQVRKNIFFSRARNYPSCLEGATKSINVPVSVYNNLIDTVNTNLPVLHRYLRLRQRAMGLPDLRIYDLYAPMVADVEYNVTFAEAKERVLAGLAPLGKEYVDALRKGFEQRWVDVVENKGKRSGAYSWGAYDTFPFMLMNWHDKMGEMFTLAHEAGHSMHSFYTRKNQPYPYGSYTLFVAEVASITNEMLLTEHLLANTDDRALKMYIINHALDEFRGTLFRQTLFAEFEKVAHAKAEAGEALTPELLCSIYKELNQKYYGVVAKLDDEIEIEWARIPHFYSSFYVYQYATGISAATALSRQIVKEGQPAVDRYLGFLSSGSSEYSLDLLRKAGVDLSTPAPVQAALDHFGGLLDKFEALLDEATKAAAPASA